MDGATLAKHAMHYRILWIIMASSREDIKAHFFLTKTENVL
jgi:hypothetical protein